MNKKQPLVSILIPMYNSSRYISHTLDCCIKQSYQNIEIIVVDDGSTDDSVEIVRSYQKRFFNIKLFTQNRSGACRARNLAFKNSSGEYIQYLDSDDLLSPNKIQRQIEIASRYNFNPYTVLNSKFSYFHHSIDDAKYFHQPINHSYNSGIDWLIDAWSGGGFGVVMGWLTHRYLIEKAGKWREELKKNQDGEFFSRVLLNAKEVIMVDDIMVYYRKSGKHSVSANMSREAIDSLLYSFELYEKNIENIDNQELKRALATLYLNFIKHHYPNYLEHIKIAKKEIARLGFDINSLDIGGKFGKLSKLIGVENTLKLYSIFKRLK